MARVEIADGPQACGAEALLSSYRKCLARASLSATPEEVTAVVQQSSLPSHQYPIEVLDSSQSQLSTSEQWFLNTYHAIGPVGVLVLKSLAFLSLKGGGTNVQVARATLAKHCSRSVRTVSRATAKLKASALILAEQPPPAGFDQWEPNVYQLTPLGLHVAALLGTNAGPPRRDMDGPHVLSQSDLEDSEEQTSAPEMARPENTTVSQQPEEGPSVEQSPPSPPACSLPPDLDPLTRELEQANPQRFAHLRDWVQARLRSGIARRHLAEALASLATNSDRVRSWAGWLQNKLEDLARAEREAARARERALESARELRRQFAEWEQERATHSSGHTLAALVAAERSKGYAGTAVP